MKATDRRDEGLVRKLFVTPQMAATLTGLAVGAAATYYLSDTTPVDRSILIAVAALSGFGFASGIYHWKTRAWKRAVAKQKNEYTDDLAREKRASSGLVRDLTVARCGKIAAEGMLDSLQSIAGEVQQLGSRPDRDAALNVIAKAVRLSSHVLTNHIVGGGEIVVCAKRLVLKGNVPWAIRLAIWPSCEGETEFEIARTRPLEKLVTQRLPYFYVSDADGQPGFQRHVQFAARTILVTPITVVPGRGIGFLWVSSELPAAFDAEPIFNYSRTLGHILAPLFIDEYARIDLPKSSDQTDRVRRAVDK